MLRAGAAVLVAAALLLAVASGPVSAGGSLMRLELHAAPDARTVPRVLLLTVGGPVYCVQLQALARNIGASLACTDYAPNRYSGAGTRAGRREDWGDPAYLAEVVRVPAQLRSEGIKISKLVLVGVSYSGFGNAELVATHPEMRPDALVVVDSYLDLPARYRVLPASHETRQEIDTVLGGTLDEKPDVYAARSPSHHLKGLAEAMSQGMRLVVVWSISESEKREFRGATCSPLANAHWLALLARALHRPVTGYVTHMPHAHALWDRGEGLLQLAGVVDTRRPLRARPVQFTPDARQLPAGSYC